MAVRANNALQSTGLIQRNGESTVWRPLNNQLQRTVGRQRGAAEPERYAPRLESVL
jgi:hypothetical protein